ncbi:8-oxo-dGTP diphosphatase [Nocardioides terrae]|uniref:8-oxo-dGTP diphosphatase n=1 Tax=Nocardioides terrae TaxID=574651 RepID=A0A1I1EMT1_9ACTN|nr:bifunctional NUDIX hydrolase/histidine phosphatase family protein [Nocardioides terrae]SFB88414.1 8-oxo-dGTP diphosphatase [Nocardioides terrae]
MPRSRPEITSAGAVVLRRGRDVLLVHRPKYDDWSFPKGKLERGEHVTAAAVREVEEETGVRVRLGRPLSSQTYSVGRARKTVHYWIARASGSDDVSAYAPNAEIDEVAWVPVSKATRVLTYPHDRDTLAEALQHPKRTRTVIVLRHAQSRARRTWHAEDALRPLLATGQRQAERLVPVLEAYGVRRVMTSSSVRCADTVAPYCRTTGTEPEPIDRLSEEHARRGKVRKLVRRTVEALGKTGPTVICTHRPVLPFIFDELGLDDPKLEKGELLVVHLRRGRVVASERH